MAVKYGAEVDIKECYTYVKAPVLASWGQWVLHVLSSGNDATSAIVRTHVKHCGRALIGRLSLRVPHWEQWGDNFDGHTGIAYQVYPETGSVHRMLHVGKDVLIEASRDEADNSLPMITGYIMAQCRCILWEAMNDAGLDHVAHVDTDSVLVDRVGLDGIRRASGDGFLSQWQVKGTFTKLVIYGPRCYYRDGERKTSGIPLKAVEVEPGKFTGEKWSSLSADLADNQAGIVRVRQAKWRLNTTDPRRRDAPGGQGRTEAYSVGLDSPSKMSADAAAATGS